MSPPVAERNGGKQTDLIKLQKIVIDKFVHFTLSFHCDGLCFNVTWCVHIIEVAIGPAAGIIFQI